jgi:hypothetical protein
VEYIKRKKTQSIAIPNGIVQKSVCLNSMVILGNHFLKDEEIYPIQTIEDISQTLPNSVVYFKYNNDIAYYCFKNSIDYAVIVDNITDAIYSNKQDAKYIMCYGNISTQIQKIAEHYLFDSKIIQITANLSDIETIAQKGIDGVCIFD